MDREKTSTGTSCNQAQEGRASELTPEQRASLEGVLDALKGIDLTAQFKAAGLSCVASPDGTQEIRFPAGAGMPDDDALLASALLPLDETNGSLPPNVCGHDDMGLLDKFRIPLCSEVSGVITLHGKPLVRASVIRRLDLFLPKDQVYTDSVFTDDEGRFEFKVAYARRWKPVLGETRIEQKLLVRHEGRLYLGWENISMGMELNGDVFVARAAKDFHIRLCFNGDLSRATALPDDFDLEQRGAEGFFNSQIVYVASLLRLTVTRDGKPVVGAKVVRTAEHVGYASYEQSKLSDIDGEVRLPEIIAPLLEHTWAKTEVRQRVVIVHEGKEYLGWERTKTNPFEYGEYNADFHRPLLRVEVVAELSEDPDRVRGVFTDPERCWQGAEATDFLPESAITFKGVFRVTRFDPGYSKRPQP